MSEKEIKHKSIEQEAYGSSKIQILEGLEAVRKRPGMYIGSTDLPGLHHMVYEIVDNSIDESMAGFCNKIIIQILPNNIISVEDNGRGIPVEIHPSVGVSTVEVVLTKLHAGGKFDKGAYKVSGGLHGVGMSVVNALSSELTVEVQRDGGCYQQSFEKGIPKVSLKKIKSSKSIGTKVIFLADDIIFDTLEYRYEVLLARMRELAFLNKELSITLSDLRNPKEKKEEVLLYKGGIVEYIQLLNSKKTAIHKQPLYINIDSDSEDIEHDVSIEIALEYTDAYTEQVFSFVNSIHTREGGTHVEGFRTALTRAINEVKKNLDLDKRFPFSLTGEDVREGLTAIISVLVPEPQFEGQTKMKLGNGEVKGIVQHAAYESLIRYFDEHPNEAKKIIEKSIASASARIAARKAKDLVRRKSALDGGSLPGKLADCTSKDASISELFIVEGDSAGGSAKQGRDRNYQAILPLKGKITNVEKTKIEKVLTDAEIKALITVIGCGITNTFDIEKIRYNKIIIMTDADVDGAHIQTLILTFFFRYMREVIDRGYLYLARPPLYLLKTSSSSIYAYSDEEKNERISELSTDRKYTLQRYKGLGEMNPDQLWETTMDPPSRVLLQVSIEDALQAEKIFVTLMGDEVAPRRKFIEDNALKVQDLDF